MGYIQIILQFVFSFIQMQSQSHCYCWLDQELSLKFKCNLGHYLKISQIQRHILTSNTGLNPYF